MLSYSVLYPLLAALLGVRVVGALGVAAAAGFSLRWRATASETGRWSRPCGSLPARRAGCSPAGWRFCSPLPGLGALLAADRGRAALGALLAALGSLASPVAGLFVALAGVAIGSPASAPAARGSARRVGADRGPQPRIPVGGEEPFVFDAFTAVPVLAVAVLWLVPVEYRALRIGVLLYAALALALS